MSTIGAGNTKAAPSQIKGRNFILTINEKTIPETENIIKYLEGLKGFVYMLICEHIGQENKHYHLYVQFEDNKRLSFKKLLGAHVEQCFGSAQQNIAYVKAEDDKHKTLGITSQLIYENGKPKLKGGIPSIKEVKEMNKEEIDELPINLINCVRRIKQEQEADIDVDDWHKDVEVYYIQGPSGIGKTEEAKKIIRTNIEKYGRKFNNIKFENGFYIGVGVDALIAVYDDFRDSHMKASEFINLIDYNKHYMNIKGGSKLNNYKLIIITSVQRLSELYRNMSGEPRQQWERRIKLVNMYYEKSLDEELEAIGNDLTI